MMPAWRDRRLATLTPGPYALDPSLTLLAEVQRENERQVAKFGVQVHSPAEWFLILGEEIGELGQAACLAQWPDATPPDIVLEHIRAEAIQVATLALKIAEMAEGAQ